MALFIFCIFLFSLFSFFFPFFHIFFWPPGSFFFTYMSFLLCSSFFPSVHTQLFTIELFPMVLITCELIYIPFGNTLYISIIKTIYNYTLNMNLYNVHPYIYLHVYAPNAYVTISLTLSFDNSITTVEQVN